MGLGRKRGLKGKGDEGQQEWENIGCEETGEQGRRGMEGKGKKGRKEEEKENEGKGNGREGKVETAKGSGDR